MNIKMMPKALLPFLFVLYLVTVGSYLYLSPNHEVSNVEYRSLQQEPEMTLTSLVDGKYVKSYEEYFTDQFPGRNIWLKLYLEFQAFTGKTFLNGYFVSDDGWIMPEPNKVFDQKLLDQSTNNLNQIAQSVTNQGTEVYFFALPHKVNIIDVGFPSFVDEGYNSKRKEYFLSKVDKENINLLDIGEIFKENYSSKELKNMYYKTDHHWNENGAAVAYEEIKKYLEESSTHFAKFENHQYEKFCSNKPFQGSYNRQIYNLLDLRTDKACHNSPKNNTFRSFKISVNGEKKSFNQVYGDGMQSKNTLVYTDVFVDDIRKLNIVNPEVKKGRALIVRDSYASPILFDMAHHFHETQILDLRHNRKGLDEILSAEKPFDLIIFLYNDAILQGELFDFTKAPLE
jgi:hypothetical protein